MQTNNEERVEVSQRRLTWIPDAIMDDGRVEKSELLVYLALARHSNKDGECWPSYQRIADLSRLSRKTVIDAVENLVTLGWIIKNTRRNEKGFTSCLYHLRDEAASLVQSLHQPSVTTTPPLVQPLHHPSVAITPEGRVLKKVEKEGGRKEGQELSKDVQNTVFDESE
jgi:hypothetical protein